MGLKTQKQKRQYVCQTCGYVALRWMGRCTECGAWNSLVEERVAGGTRRKRADAGSGIAEPKPLAALPLDDQERIKVSSAEFNQVLGGGIVWGSVILVGGDPGIGKSTLMLQEAVNLAAEDFPVLYISGEESERQTKLRAQRLGIDSQYLHVLAETDLENMTAQVEALEPRLVVVDSIQTVHHPGLDSAPGSIGQVRECALAFVRLAKSRNIPVFLIGHVTKEGYLAGPKVLEHMVDVLLHFEGDREHFYRILRSIKNRFGSTREIGVFEMKENGLQEVKNPSAIFLAQRSEDVSGSSVTCTMEGTRPFLVELQALVTPTSYGLPQRNTTGVDPKRLSLLLAVLEKRVGLRLGTHDVFVNAAGGVRIDEPCADLGILVAIASSFRDRLVDPSAVVMGEIGLGGEIRAVPQVDKRIAEAAKLGFKKAVVPGFNAGTLDVPAPLEVFGAAKVEEVLQEVLN